MDQRRKSLVLYLALAVGSNGLAQVHQKKAQITPDTTEVQETGVVYDVTPNTSFCHKSGSCGWNVLLDQGIRTEWILWTAEKPLITKDDVITAKILRVPLDKRSMTPSEAAAHLPRLLSFREETGDSAERLRAGLKEQLDSIAPASASPKPSTPQEKAAPIEQPRLYLTSVRVLSSRMVTLQSRDGNGYLTRHGPPLQRMTVQIGSSAKGDGLTFLNQEYKGPGSTADIVCLQRCPLLSVGEVRHLESDHYNGTGRVYYLGYGRAPNRTGWQILELCRNGRCVALSTINDR